MAWLSFGPGECLFLPWIVSQCFFSCWFMTSYKLTGVFQLGTTHPKGMTLPYIIPPWGSQSYLSITYSDGGAWWLKWYKCYLHSNWNHHTKSQEENSQIRIPEAQMLCLLRAEERVSSIFSYSKYSLIEYLPWDERYRDTGTHCLLTKDSQLVVKTDAGITISKLMFSTCLETIFTNILVTQASKVIMKWKKKKDTKSQVYCLVLDFFDSFLILF